VISYKLGWEQCVPRCGDVYDLWSLYITDVGSVDIALKMDELYPS